MTASTIARDPIRLELLKNAFAAISDEMAATVVRTARSYVIKEAMDFSTGSPGAAAVSTCRRGASSQSPQKP